MSRWMNPREWAKDIPSTIWPKMRYAASLDKEPLARMYSNRSPPSAYRIMMHNRSSSSYTLTSGIILGCPWRLDNTSASFLKSFSALKPCLRSRLSLKTVFMTTISPVSMLTDLLTIVIRLWARICRSRYPPKGEDGLRPIDLESAGFEVGVSACVCSAKLTMLRLLRFHSDSLVFVSARVGLIDTERGRFCLTLDVGVMSYNLLLLLYFTLLLQRMERILYLT